MANAFITIKEFARAALPRLIRICCPAFAFSRNAR